MSNYRVKTIVLTPYGRRDGRHVFSKNWARLYAIDDGITLLCPPDIPKECRRRLHSKSEPSCAYFSSKMDAERALLLIIKGYSVNFRYDLRPWARESKVRRFWCIMRTYGKQDYGWVYVDEIPSSLRYLLASGGCNDEAITHGRKDAEKLAGALAILQA